MSLGFVFKASINPKKPLDPRDPAPEGWDTGIDTHDYRKALFGYRTPLFHDCCEWQERELARIAEARRAAFVAAMV